MTYQKSPLSERAANSYSLLCEAAQDLNSISNELGKSIAEIDSALKKLNLGVVAWVSVRQADGLPEDTWFWSEDVGYAKVGATWGVSLRKISGDYQHADDEHEERWLFNDAPRTLRIAAIDKIPELLENLSAEAAKTAKSIRDRLSDVEAVANALKGTTNKAESAAVRGLPRLPGRIISTTHSESPKAERARDTVVAALEGAGHASAAMLLKTATWNLDGTRIQIQVPGVGKKMLAITVNAAAVSIIRNELFRLGLPQPFIIPDEATRKLPGQIVEQAAVAKEGK